MIETFNNGQTITYYIMGRTAWAAHIEISFEGRWLHIMHLRTHQEYLRQGYASKLLQFVIDKYPSYDMILVPHPSLGTISLAGLENFYRKFGFGYASGNTIMIRKVAR